MNGKLQAMTASVLRELNMSDFFLRALVNYTGDIFFLFLPVGFHLLSFSSKSKYLFTVLVKMFSPVNCLPAS